MRLCPSFFAVPLLAAALTLGSLTGCASSPPPVTSEMAADADMAVYPTFAFFEPFDLEREGYGTFAGERARAVLRHEMEVRGYRLDPENPALRINLIAIAPARPRAGPQISLGLGFGGGSARGGLGVGLPLDGGSRESSRWPGAITMDLVDAQARRVVWTSSVDVMRSGRDGQRKAFETALVRAMAPLPPR